MSRIFENKTEMPPHAGSPDVVRTAMSPGDVVNVHITEGGLAISRAPAALSIPDESVKHVTRPIRGRPY